MKKLLIILLTFLPPTLSFAQYGWQDEAEGGHWVNTKYNTTEGTEFWVTFMRNSGGDETDASSMTLYLYATAREKAHVTVENPNTGYVGAFDVEAGKQATFKVPNEQAYIQLPKLVSNLGLRVTSTVPISLYSTSHHVSGKYDATNVLPTKALLDEYVLQTYLADVYATEFAIVATENQNISLFIKETIINQEDFNEEGVANIDEIKEKDTTIYLQRGQAFLIRSEYITGSLSGTVICSDKPFAVFQGGQSAKITQDPENHIFHQAYTTDQWGKTFVTVPTHNAIMDITRLTAAESGTIIYRNGGELVRLNRLETFQDTIYSEATIHKGSPVYITQDPNVVVYTANKPISVFLYGTGYTDNLDVANPENVRSVSNYILGSPVMTPIIPQEYASQSSIFATFNQSTNSIKNYVNIVTPTSEVGGMRLDNQDISDDFHSIVGTDYSYVIKEVSAAAHKIENSNKGIDSRFTARVYGLGKSSSARESYAYAAGSRVERSADILLNDQYLDTLEICDNEQAWLEGIIRYDYTDVDWRIIDSSAISGYGFYPYNIPDSAIKQFDNKIKIDPFYFPHVPYYGPKDWTVNMFVQRTTPLCNHIIQDTITATIRVYPTHANDTAWETNGEAREFCYNDKTRTIDIEYSDDGKNVVMHHFYADTIHEAQINKAPYGTITFKLDSVYTIIDSLKNKFDCDSIVERKFIIRPTYDTIMYDTICVNHLPYTIPLSDTQAFSEIISLDLTTKQKKDLIRTKTEYVRPVIKDTTVVLHTIHGCDSTVHLNIAVLPIYNVKDKDVEECKDTTQAYEWEKHTDKHGHPLSGHRIYMVIDENGDMYRLSSYDSISLSIPGTYTYVDSLKTRGCKRCDDRPGCDSVYRFTLVVKDQIKYYETKYICENDTFEWHNKLYIGPKYQGTIQPKWQTSDQYLRVKQDTTLFCKHPTKREGECDSLYYLNVFWCPTYPPTIEEHHICENETYAYKPRFPQTHSHDKVYNQNHEWACVTNEDGTKEIGRYELIDTVKTITPCEDGGVGCDSIVKHIIHVHPVYRDTIDTAVCQVRGGKYIWSKHTNRRLWDDKRHHDLSSEEISINDAGDFVYIDSLKTVSCTDCRNGIGCDSVWVLRLKVTPIYDPIVSKIMCETDSLHWEGKVYVGGKAPEEWQKGQKNLYWADPKPRTGDREDQYRRPKRYEVVTRYDGVKYCDTVHLHTIDGCDSIIWLDLTVSPSYLINDTNEICDNESISWEGKKIAGNKYTGTADFKHTASKDYYTYEKEHKTKVNGCDSTRVLHLKVLPTYDMPVFYDTICDTEPYSWDLYDHGTGQTISIPITRPASDVGKVWRHTEQYTLHTVKGCDSIIHLDLTVKPTIHVTKTHNICPEQLPYEYAVGQPPATEAGEYTEHITRDVVGGCDSITKHIIEVSEEDFIPLPPVQICDNEPPYSYDYGAEPAGTKHRHRLENLHATGVYRDTVEIAGQCRKIYELHLTVNSTYDMNPLLKSVCVNDLPYRWTRGDNPSVLIEEINLPDGESLPYTHTYAATLQTKYTGCDSIVHLQLTINPVYSAKDTVRKCDTEMDDYIYRFDTKEYRFNQQGKLDHKTILHIDTTLNTPTKDGCDSIMCLHLIVYPSYQIYDTLSMCGNDSVHWQGMLFTGYEYANYGRSYIESDFDSVQRALAPSQYDYAIRRGTSAYDCDSVHHLHLTVKSIGRETIERRACQNQTGYYYENLNRGHGGTLPARYLSDSLTRNDTIVTAQGCDSIITLHYYVDSVYNYTSQQVVCQAYGEDWIWYENGIPQDTISLDKGDTTYVLGRRYATIHGCDSTYGKSVYVAPIYHYYDTLSLCENDSLHWQGMQFIGSQYEAYGKTYSEAGFDSTRVLSHGTYHIDIRRPTIHDCDSTYHLTLYVHEVAHTDSVDSVCQGDPFFNPNWNRGEGMYMNTERVGTYVSVDTILSKAGCDSIVTLTLRVDSVYSYTKETVVCQVYEGEWTWEENGVPQMTISIDRGDTTWILGTRYTTIHGCDSTYGISVYVAPIYHYYDTLNLCENDSLHWQGMQFIGSQYEAYGKSYGEDGFDSTRVLSHGTHHFDIRRPTIHDCDSTYHLTLYVHEVAHTDSVDSVCQGHPFHNPNWNWGEGMYMNTERVGTYVSVDTIHSVVTNCDSIVTLTLRVDSVYDYRPFFEFCQDTIDTDTLVEWEDEAGKLHTFRLDISKADTLSYTDSLTSIHGCDSIFGVTWIVHPIYRFDTIIEICEDGRFVWQDTLYTGDSARVQMPEDSVFLAPGTYHRFKHHETVAGCDSDYYAVIHVHAVYDTLTRVTVCESDGFVWLQEDNPHGEHHNYVDTIIPVAYCDTIRLLPYEANLPQPKRDTVMRYHERMLQTVHGCDSLSRIWVTVQPTYCFLTDTTICSNDRVKYRGKFFSSKDTIYVENQPTEDGCDSVYILRLHVRPIFINTRRVTICDNDTLFHESQNKKDIVWGPGNEIRDPEWEYYDMVYTDVNGCDSIYRYYITIHPSYLFLDTATMCSSDSVILLDNHYVGERIVYPTEMYVEPYTAIYDTAFKTIHECDSIYRIQATIYPTYHHWDTIVICDDGEANWREHHYVGNMFGNVLGDGLPVGEHVFFDKYKTVQYGCDSIYELLLRVLPTYLMTDSLSKCVNDAMTWHGQKLDVLPLGEHFFFDSLTTKSGCDSVYHLYLTVLDTTFEVRYDTICETEYYDLHGRKIGTAGTYKDTIPNAWGCDHYTYLHLHVIPPTYYWLNIPELCADDSIMEIGYDYIGRDLIEYSIYFDSLAHAQGFVDIVHEPITDIPNQIIEIPVPYGDTLPRPGKPYFDTWQAREHYSYASKYAYPRPDHYSMRVVMHNGICQDPIQSKDTTYDILYPSWIHEQHWNDGIVLFNELYNGGYEFEKYQWYHNGRPIIGQTREFLYWPDSLGINDPQDFYVDEYNHKRCLGDEYRVLLTRKGENYGIFTCPICPVHVYDRLVPTEDFFSVVPTLVVKDYPYVWILATKPVHYTIYNIDGARITHGYVKLSREHYEEQIYLGKMEKEGIVTMVLRTDDGEERKFKIMVVYENSRPPYSIR